MPLRPRNLFVNNKYNGSSQDKPLQSRNEFSKYYEKSLLEKSLGVFLHQSSSASSALNTAVPLWMKPRSKSLGRIHPLPYYSSDETNGYPENWKEIDETGWGSSALPNTNGCGFPVGIICTSRGILSLALSDYIHLDMTVERSIRIINYQNNIVLAISGSGSASALRHPNGCVYQYGSRAEIVAHDSLGNHKYAKMWYKGVSFTSERCALVYLVDSAGTRTTTDTFSNLSCIDFSIPIFYEGTERSTQSRQAAMFALQDSHYWLSENGVQNWVVCNVRISLTPDGLVRVARNSNKYLLKLSESSGNASLTTPYLHCTASMGKTSHLFVRRGERRMHFDGSTFIVRNAGHSAGFDEKNQLKVY